MTASATPRRGRPAHPPTAPVGNDPLSAWLRPVVWHLLNSGGHTQVWLAHTAGVGTKHLNQVLQGKVGLSPDMAVRILAALGYQLVLGITPLVAAQAPTANVCEACGGDVVWYVDDTGQIRAWRHVDQAASYRVGAHRPVVVARA